MLPCYRDVTTYKLEIVTKKYCANYPKREVDQKMEYQIILILAMMVLLTMAIDQPNRITLPKTSRVPSHHSCGRTIHGIHNSHYWQPTGPYTRLYGPFSHGKRKRATTGHTRLKSQKFDYSEPPEGNTFNERLERSTMWDLPGGQLPELAHT